MNEMELIESKEVRATKLGRIEVLDRVGGLVLLPNVEVVTTRQLSEYFNVDMTTIKKTVERNTKELEDNGMKLLKGVELKDFKTQILKVANVPKDLNSAPSIRIFNRRAILNVAMLLRDSEIAQEIRKYLLDIEHDTSIQSPEIIVNKLQELSEEKSIMLELVEAQMDGDLEKVNICHTKLYAIKNKRIKELEDTNQLITSNALTIIDSKAIINRLVRAIAVKEYSGMFGKAYGDLYAKANYKLGINIKARDKKKSESYLDTLAEDEVFEVEKIVRNWALDSGLDLDNLLKL